MSSSAGGYPYVGSASPAGAGGPPGQVIRSAEELAGWLAGRPPEEPAEPFTFVVDLDGTLRLAARRSEHVACAGGRPVLSAGEIAFERSADGGWAVEAVSNQSTGYCPDVTSWAAVEAALERIGVGHPGGFTHEVVFRRCPGCREINLVKEEDFVCAFCGGELPAAWNVA
ncbi:MULTISPECIES: hypothetical protein [unclassified Nonomuraea]|uniref:hypothetical protein n=1 Tax=unclassified Nonomuraea TaxID=2593643 RepID=UPI0035C09D78